MPDKTVNITYNTTTQKVIVPATPININQRTAVIQFDLACNPALPAGHTARIRGIEFPKSDEPGSTYAPDKVFGNEESVTMNGAAHTLFGVEVGTTLQLTDNNNVTSNSGDQEYGYKVWIELDTNSGGPVHVEGYKASDDPKIKNTEPPPGG